MRKNCDNCTFVGCAVGGCPYGVKKKREGFEMIGYRIEQAKNDACDVGIYLAKRKTPKAVYNKMSRVIAYLVTKSIFDRGTGASPTAEKE